MSMSSRIKAFLAYLFLALGGVIVLLLSKNDRYAAFHARQSIALTIVAVLAPIIWAPIAYVIGLIPFVGPLLSSSSFALVIALFIVLIVVWIMGMVRALRGEVSPLPFVGGVATRWLGA